MSHSGGTTSPEWYADGLRFQCTQCGNCCTGPPGYVWITPEESAAIAAELELSRERFEERYTRTLTDFDDRRSLNERLTEHGHDCIFLDRETLPGKAVCSIYATRPAQCRTWPFWPENLRSSRVWSSTKRRTPCPGMDEGKLVPVEQIRIMVERSG